MEKYYYIVKSKNEKLGRYEVKTPNQLEGNDEIICVLAANVWFDFMDEYRDKIPDMSLDEFKQCLIEYDRNWYKR